MRIKEQETRLNIHEHDDEKYVRIGHEKKKKLILISWGNSDNYHFELRLLWMNLKRMEVFTLQLLRNITKSQFY